MQCLNQLEVLTSLNQLEVAHFVAKQANMHAWSSQFYGLAHNYQITVFEFYMSVHVGDKFIHAKFHAPDGYADMAKKLKFWILWVFLGDFFCK